MPRGEGSRVGVEEVFRRIAEEAQEGAKQAKVEITGEEPETK